MDHKKSVADLAGAMSLHVDQVWLQTGGTEVLTPIDAVRAGDRIVIRTGSVIPLDGRVSDGEAMVNQSSMTGESMPVAKRPGSYVYAGTVVEEGQCVVCVEKASGGGRYDRIVRMIEESEKLKSTAEDRASRLADRLVPYTLGGTALTYLLTRNVTKTLSVLMVDFSCALKLAIPIAVLSAMRECSERHISVKGGRFMEAVAQADTIVFDKTGTLTYATPRVAEIVPFGGRDPQEMLRLAACLEEHYPHSMANAWWRRPGPEVCPTRSTTPRCSMWWPTASPAWWRGKRSSSAAPTSCSRTRAAGCRRGRTRSSGPSPPPIPTCTCASPGSWPP